MGLLLGLPLSQPRRTRSGRGCRSAVSLFLGLGMLGLTVAKRERPAHRRRGDRARPAAGADGRRAARAGDPHIVVDTSAIIDGRIAEIVESGFIYGTLVVPRFVLDELQHIADSSDTLRRNRGRRGPRDPRPDAEGLADAGRDRRRRRARTSPRSTPSSSRSPRRAQQAILTNDFNLNRVAELQGVRVLNINSLANAVKPAVLPGEELRVRVIQEGKEAGPGRRLPRRRHDDRRRGRRPLHRQGPRRRR